MEKVVWKWEYGVYVPFCPYCDEPAYEHDRCVFCGAPYQWEDGEVQPTQVTVGEYTVVQATNNHLHIYQNGKLVYLASCENKMTEDELKSQIELYRAS